MKKITKLKGSKATIANDEIEIDPSIIRFTHSKIRPFFSGCGKQIVETLNDIIVGKLLVEDLPLITVLCNNGFYFSLNNRRLYVLKILREGGYLASTNNLIKARIKIPLSREIEKYTLERCSLQAKIMSSKSKPSLNDSKLDPSSKNDNLFNSYNGNNNDDDGCDNR